MQKGSEIMDHIFQEIELSKELNLTIVFREGNGEVVTPERAHGFVMVHRITSTGRYFRLEHSSQCLDEDAFFKFLNPSIVAQLIYDTLHERAVAQGDVVVTNVHFTELSGVKGATITASGIFEGVVLKTFSIKRR